MTNVFRVAIVMEIIAIYSKVDVKTWIRKAAADTVNKTAWKYLTERAKYMKELLAVVSLFSYLL